MTIEKTIYCIISICYFVAIAAFLSPSTIDEQTGFYCLLAAIILTVIPLLTALLLPLVTSVVVCAALFLACFVLLSFGKVVWVSLVAFQAGNYSQMSLFVAGAVVVAFGLLKTESCVTGSR